MCPLKDRAQNAVVRSAVYDNVMLQIVFLHLKCNGNAIRRFQIVGMCGHEKSISEEADVSEAQESRALLFLPWDFGVFTRPASEKGYAYGELCN
jgi:hypothetical protein